MGQFKVKSTYYLPPRDLLVLTGDVVTPRVEPGMWLDLPKELDGPGKVQIASMEYVQFADRSQQLAICLPMNALSESFSFDLSSVEGEVLKVSG